MPAMPHMLNLGLRRTRIRADAHWESEELALVLS
jgi:hypothetical protein